MKKNHIALLFAAVCALCLSLGGCARSTPGAPPTPNIAEDFFYLAAQDVYFTYSAYDNGSLYIPLISAFPIVQEDMEVILGGRALKQEEEFSLSGYVAAEGGEKVQMPFYLYQSFRGKDWRAAAEPQLKYLEVQRALEKGGGDRPGLLESQREAEAAIAASQNEFLADYQTLQSMEKLPVLYRYLLYLRLPGDEPFSEEPITELTLRIQGREETFPVGMIWYRTDRAQHTESHMGPATLITSVGISGWHGAAATADGKIKEMYGAELNRLRALEDVTVTDIGLWDDSRTISDIQVIIMNVQRTPDDRPYFNEDGNEVIDIIADFVWDGKTPFRVMEGQQIAINFTLNDPRLAGAIRGYTQYNLAIHYENDRGEHGISLKWFPTRIETISNDPFEVYLQYVLGIDVMSYYTDYYNVLEAEGTGIVIIETIQEG